MSDDNVREKCGRLRELIDQYWDIGWSEGLDARNYDSKEGAAQDCRRNIEAAILDIENAQRQGGEAADTPVEGWVCKGESSLCRKVFYGETRKEAERKMEESGFFSYQSRPLYTASQTAVPDGRQTGRPDNFEFAMDFLGDPEAASVREYIEHLEAKAAPARRAGSAVAGESRLPDGTG